MDIQPSEPDCGRLDCGYPSRWWREPEAWLLVLLVGGTYFARLDTLSVRGEEPRRARVAYEMLHSGDWIVPRQQGEIYLSRPPLGNWLIAAVGSLRGEIDATAIRLPSAIATVLTALGIYIYCRAWLARLGAFAGGLGFGTTALVLELGRLGETEAVLTCCVAGSLLTWHSGYLRRWPPPLTWSLGYALAALAALAKGPQGPVYFVASVTVYLALCRDWRFLFSRAHLAGILAFALVIGAWQIPFAARTDWHSVVDIWCANAAERFADNRLSTFARHLVMYPLELFCCFLPWSLPLLYLANRRFRRSLADLRPWVGFSLVAIGVCLPTVWLAASAKGRYFMPLFPAFAILVGVVVERCWRAGPGSAPRRAWNQFLAALAAAAAVAGLLVIGVSCGLAGLPHLPAGAAQPPLFAAAYALLAGGTAACLFVARRAAGTRWALPALAAVAVLLACTCAGVAVNIRLALSADTPAAIARLKSRIPPGTRLASLGQISHVFAYHFGGMIPLVPWPRDASALGADLDYFCFSKLTDEQLDPPFAWEPIDVVVLDRDRRAVPERTVVVGRRLPEPRLVSSTSD